MELIEFMYFVRKVNDLLPKDRQLETPEVKRHIWKIHDEL